MGKILVILLMAFVMIAANFAEESYCSKAYGCSGDNSIGKVLRYILYDVNVGEGFNLKRDVYMRMAMFMRALKENSRDDWHLVLPPWTKQWHWTTEQFRVSYQWHHFFDVESLLLYSPVIEIDQFYKEYGESVDEVYILQHFPEFYEWTGEGRGMDWSDRWSYAECRDHPYWKQDDGKFVFFRGTKRVNAKRVKCISFQGTSGYLESVVSSTKVRSIMFERAEIATHIEYGGSNYWLCRRSMRFAKLLVMAANIFRATSLNSSDEQDHTVRPPDWREERPQRSARGGPYLGVHLRRQDFVYGRPNEVPSLTESTIQIKRHLRQLNLTIVFVATDMPAEEYEYISRTLEKDGFKSIKYDAKDDERDRFKEGGLAIIDQIIASHARFFVGTYESTFTYRIQEEREIMGFPVDTTFNRFCPSSDIQDCTPPTKWLIKYPENHSRKSSGEQNVDHFDMDEL